MFSTTSPAVTRFHVLQAVKDGNTLREIAYLVAEQRRSSIHCAHHGWNPFSERVRRIVSLHFHYLAYQVRVVASPIMMKLAYTARAWHTLCSAMVRGEPVAYRSH